MKKLILTLILFLNFITIESATNNQIEIRYSRDGKKVIVNKSSFKVFTDDSNYVSFKVKKIRNRKLKGYNDLITNYEIKTNRKSKPYFNKGKGFFIYNSGIDDRSGLLSDNTCFYFNYSAPHLLETNFVFKSRTGFNAGINFFEKSYYVGLLQQIVKHDKRNYGLVISAAYMHPTKKWEGELFRFTEISLNNTFILNNKTFANFNLKYSLVREYGLNVSYEDGIEYYDYVYDNHHVIGFKLGMESKPLSRLAVFTDISLDYEVMGSDSIYYFNFSLNGNHPKKVKSIEKDKLKFNDFKVSSGIKLLFPTLQIDLGCIFDQNATLYDTNNNFPLIPLFRTHFQMKFKKH